nr:FISUMP domain-containing protein [Bacteroides acidifaciens]
MPESVTHDPADIENEEAITSLNAYLFIDDMLAKVERNISVDGGTLTMDVMPEAEIYFLANLEEPAPLQMVQTGRTGLSDFLALRSAEKENEETSLFFSGSCRITDLKSDVHRINLQRSVAQIDLDTSAGERILVTRIVVREASGSTTLFPSINLSSPVTRRIYDIKYETPVCSMENVFRLYESNVPVDISVYVEYNGNPAVVNLSLHEVRRNFKYTIRLTEIEATIRGAIQVVPWIDNGNIEAAPDPNGKIYLSKEYSELPEGIDINENIISVSDKGGEVILAFISDVQTELVSMEGQSDSFKMAPREVESMDKNVITKFWLGIAKQKEGRMGYQVTLRMKQKGQQFLYDTFLVNVAVNQIPEVTIGGVTWMAFNATTRNLEDQVYLPDGTTVEDMYNKSWESIIGGLFQWGRIYMYPPGLSGSSNAGKQEQNIPWAADTHVPCPDGYRLPTRAEMRALLPPLQRLPGEYMYNGERIEATLIIGDPAIAHIDKAVGETRTLRLESETGTVLYIPLAGDKMDITTASPELGAGFTLWTSENDGAVDGSAWVGQYWPGKNGDSAIMSPDTQSETEWCAYVRCVKK